MKESDARSAVMKAASVLRTRVLSMEEGVFLGSEDDLIDELGVSRPTFRQAARLLAHEQLLTIKRGVGGGFFVRRPSIDTVSRSAATYLRSRDTTLDQVMDVTVYITRIALNLALQCRDETARDQLATLRGKLLERQERRETPSELMDLEMELADVLGAMSGNPAIALCLHMFFRFGIDQTNIFLWAHHPKRVARWGELRLRVVEAILARDEQAARELFDERGKLARSWVDRERSRSAANGSRAGRSRS